MSRSCGFPFCAYRDAGFSQTERVKHGSDVARRVGRTGRIRSDEGSLTE